MTISPAGALDDCARRLGTLAHRDEPLGSRTTYRVGGAAAVFVEANTVADLGACAQATAATGVKTLVIGNGSNILVADNGFPGLAIYLGSGLAEVAVAGTAVIAGGAAPLPVVARKSVAAGLAGFEWAVGVPGTIGGAVRMNAGGHGSDMAASLVSIRVIDLATGKDAVVAASTLDLGYRTSSVRAHQVVCEATLHLEVGDPDIGRDVLRDIVGWRRANQPGGQNAGSVFTNPPGDSAGRLIEAAGAKGLRIGSAEVSTKHANFIQADSGGSADDVLAVIDAVRAVVRDYAGVDLRPETHLVGFPEGGAR
jgi:UDP-N-acetylmuramate dehydrogenase